MPHVNLNISESAKFGIFNSQFNTLFKKQFVAKMASLRSLSFLKRKDYSSNSIEKNKR
jgi:hypothetical protein